MHEECEGKRVTKTGSHENGSSESELFTFQPSFLNQFHDLAILNHEGFAFQEVPELIREPDIKSNMRSHVQAQEIRSQRHKGFRGTK